MLKNILSRFKKAPEQPAPKQQMDYEERKLPEYNRYSDLHHSLCLKIREGRRLNLSPDPTGWALQEKWQKEAIEILKKDLAGDWMPEVQEILMLGDMYYDKPVQRTLTPAQIVARQIKSLESFAWRLYRNEVI